MRALYVAATGMHSQQTNVEVISNNLANMTTTGYKRQRAEFEDLLYQAQSRVGSSSSDVGTVVPTGIQLGLGVKPAATYRIHEQGVVQRTEGLLDVAVQGKGFFSVQLPSGELAYTRDGTFQLSPDGEIVNNDGYIVSPGITIPDNAVDVIISANGNIEVRTEDQIELQNIGQLELTTFVNPAGLLAP